MNKSLTDLLKRHPQLSVCSQDIQSTFEVLCNSFDRKGKLLIAGNGGSASDAEHISGELLKSFEKPRKLTGLLSEKLPAYLRENLQGSLPVIPLTAFNSLSTAFANDVDPQLIFACLLFLKLELL